MQYQLTADPETVRETDTDTGLVRFIPSNNDASEAGRAYQTWLAIEGNTPLAAE